MMENSVPAMTVPMKKKFFDLLSKIILLIKAILVSLNMVFFFLAPIAPPYRFAGGSGKIHGGEERSSYDHSNEKKFF